MPLVGQALMYAIGGVARGGATRGGYVSPKVFISVGGIQRAYQKPTAAHRIDGLTISKARTGSPNRANFTAIGWTPTVGMDVIITLGTKNRLRRLFGGTVLTVGESAVGQLQMFSVQCVDWMWSLNRTKVIGHFTGSPSTIAAQWMEDYAPDGFTWNQIESGLPTLTGGITVTNDDLSVALQRLAKRAGAVAYIDPRKDLSFRVTASALYSTNPTTLTDNLDTLKKFSLTRDLSQVFNRVSMEGGGSAAAAEVAVGETIIPLLDAPETWYGDVGGVVLAGPQKISYAARVAGSGGGLVGPGASPSAKLTLTGEFGTALDANASYYYGYTFVTAAGESLISPLKHFSTSTPVTPPSAAYSVIAHTGTPIFGTGVYVYGISWEFPGTLRSAIGAFEAVVVSASATDRIDLSSIPQPADVAATGINIWRTELSGYTGLANSLKLVATIGVGTTIYSDTTLDGALGAAGHLAATALCRQVRITNIPAGQFGVVTQRKPYRTVGGGLDPKLLTTLADNTTATYLDQVADGSLGADDPATDTSGLTPQAGQVLAGATSVPINGGDFPDAGWALTSTGVLIRYTGRSVSAITGVPPTGEGSLQSPLAYNATIAPAPQLTGVTGILYTIPRGQDVNCFVTVDDFLAQAELAAALNDGSDGVRAHVLNDRRLSRAEATARAQAFLELRATAQPTAAYLSKDMNSDSGPVVTVDLDSPIAVDDTFAIQAVSISNFTPNIPPDYQVTASTELFSIEDLLSRDTA